jgi:hypothetical protein
LFLLAAELKASAGGSRDTVRVEVLIYSPVTRTTSSKVVIVRQQSPSRLIEKRVDLLAPYSGEFVQKLVDAVTAFEIVDQRLHRHPGAYEDGGTTQDLGV